MSSANVARAASTQQKAADHRVTVAEVADNTSSDNVVTSKVKVKVVVEVEVEVALKNSAASTEATVAKVSSIVRSGIAAIVDARNAAPQVKAAELQPHLAATLPSSSSATTPQLKAVQLPAATAIKDMATSKEPVSTKKIAPLKTTITRPSAPLKAKSPKFPSQALGDSKTKVNSNMSLKRKAEKTEHLFPVGAPPAKKGKLSRSEIEEARGQNLNRPIHPLKSGSKLPSQALDTSKTTSTSDKLIKRKVDTLEDSKSAGAPPLKKAKVNNLTASQTNLTWEQGERNLGIYKYRKPTLQENKARLNANRPAPRIPSTPLPVVPDWNRTTVFTLDPETNNSYLMPTAPMMPPPPPSIFFPQAAAMAKYEANMKLHKADIKAWKQANKDLKRELRHGKTADRKWAIEERKAIKQAKLDGEIQRLQNIINNRGAPTPPPVESSPAPAPTPRLSPPPCPPTPGPYVPGSPTPGSPVRVSPARRSPTPAEESEESEEE